MNSGIYALYWWDQDLVYIGLSQNLQERKTEHFSKLKNGRHTNYKVQNAYNQYGNPEFIVLEYCSISELTSKEIEWCQEFDALSQKGLCLVEPGVVGFGVSSNASKYQKLQILKIFRQLYLTNYGHKHIQELLNIPKTLVFDIYSGRAHLWLAEKYPQQYNLMRQKSRKTHQSHNSSQDKVLSPSGKVFTITNRQEFARLHGLEPQHLRAVMLGTRKQHKGWKKWQGC